jgi:glycosyltransferase involved in cell wall biosynthesis
MYCGSCMHDNTLAAALTRLGVDVQLVPTYTPIRTDEGDVSSDRVFFGGVNVYLQQRFPFFRFLPAFVDGLLSHPRLLRWAASRGAELAPEQLGRLTVSMLRGEQGAQRKEVRRLCHWLATAVQPHLVALTNMLIGGCLPALKSALRVPLVVTLQGDDVFLESLPAPYRLDALQEIRRLVAFVDGFLVHSRYYAEFMRDYFGIPAEKLHVVPLGIDTRDFSSPVAAGAESPAAATTVVSRPPTVGYLARLAPEKGLHILVEAFLQLRQLPGTADARLRIAGWLGASQRAFAEDQLARLRDAGLDPASVYAGSPARRGKIAFLRELDVLSVPTVYREPKGLYVLESLAAGVPVVQPAHGAFPELIAGTGGGCLVPPNDPQALAATLRQLLLDRPRLARYADAGRRAVHERWNADTAARSTLTVLRRIAGDNF